MSHTSTERTAQGPYAEIAANKDLTACEAMMAVCREYARQRPEMIALWGFGVGFVLGWALKPW